MITVDDMSLEKVSIKAINCCFLTASADVNICIRSYFMGLSANVKTETMNVWLHWCKVCLYNYAIAINRTAWFKCNTVNSDVGRASTRGRIPKCPQRNAWFPNLFPPPRVFVSSIFYSLVEGGMQQSLNISSSHHSTTVLFSNSTQTSRTKEELTFLTSLG